MDDLIVASFLNSYELTKLNNQWGMRVPIVEDKMQYLTDYLEHHALTELVELNAEDKTFLIRPNLMLEQKLREWTVNGDVNALNPADIRMSTLFVWTALFAQRREFGVVVPTGLSPKLQITFEVLFSKYIESAKLVSNGKAFQIQPFLEVFLLSIIHKRPVMETGEFSYMLSDSDKRRVRKTMLKLEEEGEIRNA